MSIHLPDVTLPTHEPIELDEISLYHLRPRLRFPFKTSFGTQQDRDTILVVLKTKSGLVGMGEAPTLTAPIFDAQYVWAEYDVLTRFLIPVIQQDLAGRIENFDQLQATFAKIKGHSFSKCGIEAAYWQLVSQQNEQSLKDLWGGGRSTVFGGFSIGGESVEDVLARATRAVEVGFKRLKVKIWPGFDVEVVAALCEHYPDMMLQVDANCAYERTNPDHRRALKSLNDFDLLLIEQPFAPGDLFDHARFQADHDLHTPVGLDESIKSLDDARRAVELWQHFGISDRLVINIKPGRVGGYWESRLIAEFVHQRGIPCWMGGMLELGWGKWMNIILSSHPGCTLPGDHLQPQPYYDLDVVSPLPVIQSDGTIPVPDAVDFCTIDWKAIEQLTINQTNIHIA